MAELVCGYSKCKRPILDRDEGRIVSEAPFDFDTGRRVETHYHQSCWLLHRKELKREANKRAKEKRQ